MGRVSSSSSAPGGSAPLPGRNLELSSTNGKALPSLPSRWSRFCDQIRIVLRSIGLGIVVISFQGLFRKRFVEPLKVAVSQNRVSALLRSVIHIIPVAIALLEVIINWQGRYLGAIFDQQTSLQFASKAHGIAIQASLATVLLSYLRYTLTQGKGLPFGAFLSSVQFLQVSYLWSTEFWSALFSKRFRPRNKVIFILLAFSCTIIAAIAGPSSATLLIPEQKLWDLQSFRLSLDGTTSVFWPTILDGGQFPKDCGELSFNASIDDPRCPLNEFIGDVQADLLPLPLNLQPVSLLSISHFNTELNYEKTVYSRICNSAKSDQYCATTPQEIFAPSLTNFPPIGAVGLLPGEPTTYKTAYMTIQDKYYQPYTIASCLNDEVDPTTEATLVSFARLSETASDLAKSRSFVSITYLTMQHFIQAPGNISQYRSSWIDLPRDTFSTQVPGILIVHPMQYTNSYVNVTTCTLNAGWGSSKITTYSQEAVHLNSRMASNPPSWPPEKIKPIDAAGVAQQGYPDFANLSGSAYPEKRIEITQDWMRLLNPVLRSASGDNSTMFDSTLSLFENPPSEADIARTLSMFLASALSKTGAAGTGFNVTPDSSPGEPFCDDCLEVEILRSIYGYSYQLDTVGAKLSITVMLAYCLLAVGQTLYALISGISSSAWDSVAELIALAMNSKPTHVLQNTCAGIIGVKLFRAAVGIRETTEGHLELCFGGDGEVQGGERVRVNEKYGKMKEEEIAARKDKEQ